MTRKFPLSLGIRVHEYMQSFHYDEFVKRSSASVIHKQTNEPESVKKCVMRKCIGIVVIWLADEFE